jgi:hypothetical protein
MPVDDPRCRGTSRRCRAVRRHSAGRGARPAGHPTSTRAVRGGTGDRTRRCESGSLRHPRSRYRGSRERTWFRGSHALGSFRRCLLSLGRGPPLEGAAFREPALAAGVPTPALRRTGANSPSPDCGGMRLTLHAWVDLHDRDASLDPLEIGRLVAGLHRVEFAGTIGLDWRRALTRASKRRPSPHGPAATSRRCERRVAFAITPAAERIAVGSART